MSFWKRRKQKTRADPQVFTVSPGEWEEILCCSEYTRLSDSPEVQTAVGYIADLISSMTIHLMQNTADGDIRIQNELSKKVDISPSKIGTRKTWMYNIVRNLLIEGNQVVYPKFQEGYLEDLISLPPSAVSFVPKENSTSYSVRYFGREYSPDEVLHFLVNPDPNAPWKGMGYRVPLRDIVHNLKQAAQTKRGFMESKWKPSIIVRVDALAEEFSGRAGRARFLEQYVETQQAGQPWVIPAELLDIQQIKPLSLNDLAINEAVNIDKKTVAGILGVPPYVVGAGDFHPDEHRNFIDTYLMPKVQIIEQELTKKLLWSPDLYFKLNSRTLYGYNIKDLSEVGQELYVRGIMSGNEVRSWINLPPEKGLDERVILENYIPVGMIGDQKKLIQKGETDESEL